MEYKAVDGYIFADKQGNKLGKILYLGNGDSVDNYRQVKEGYSVPPPEITISDIEIAMADLDAQREADKLETQLAIAELAEMITGGVSNG